MFSRYSLHIVRNVRTPSKRATARVIINNNDVVKSAISVGEDDLQKLVQQNEVQYDQLPMHPQNMIDKTNFIPEVTSSEEFLKPKPKRTIIKLKDTVVKGSLTEEITEENQYDYITSFVTPLSKYPYHKQLIIKQRHTEDILRELRLKLKEVEAPVNTVGNRLPCPVENVVPSPDIIQYRNKDEFSVHRGVDGNPKTVGYFVGMPIDPLMRCVPPTPLINIKESHKLVRKHFQSFIEQSPYNTCFNFKEGGVWRSIIVRSNLKEELMAIVVIYPNDLTADAIEELKQSLRQYFFSGEGAECGLSSLYLQACPYSKCSRETAPYALIEGKLHLTEECLGHTFQISPDSFFQTNTRGAEALYSSIQKIAELSPLTTLLDICCGTGIISILLAPNCRAAVGIDATSGAIEDAKTNAKYNNVHNVNYVNGKVEKVISILANDLRASSDVVAVVNPARSGLHSSVIDTIRECESIKKLIFVTCKPEGNAMKNLMRLGSTLQPKNKLPVYDTPPFALRYAIPVDLFPQTAHVENIFLLERVENY